MSTEIETITAAEATRILGLDEGHYLDLKRIEIAPGKLSETVSAFANTGGGEIFVGIAETKANEGKLREWAGFTDVEAANAHLQIIDALVAFGNHYSFTFLKCEDFVGLVLYLTVFKVKGIVEASNHKAYVRRGAQNLSVTDDEGIRRLRLDKGLDSFEDETLDVAPERINNSVAMIEFALAVVPTANPDDWTLKQNLVFNGKPTVAGTILFDDEPQAVLPKRSAVKLYRYTSKADIGTRETLAFDPVTIEGCAYAQIKKAVTETKALVEGIKRLGEKGLEDVVYPDETLHEIITNAVLHRDYSIAADVHIRIFDNRIEVESPGRLPGHVTTRNILVEQSARNPKVVRLINKFPNPPNKDVGEGLNTAFDAMKKLRLKAPEIIEKENSLLVNIRHDPLASPHDAVMGYLDTHDLITNSIARELTGIRSENSMKEVFLALKKTKLLEPVPELKGSASAWRKFTGENKANSEDLFGGASVPRQVSDEDAQNYAESRNPRPPVAKEE